MRSYIRDPETGNTIEPMRQPGYYPGYSTLSQRKFWDATTRKIVEDRVIGKHQQLMTDLAN